MRKNLSLTIVGLILITGIIVLVRIDDKKYTVEPISNRTFKSQNGNFEIDIPTNWDVKYSLDEIDENKKPVFQGTFGLENLSLYIKINLAGEVTPVLPNGKSYCSSNGTTTLFNKYQMPIYVFSSSNQESNGGACSKDSIGDSHSVFVRFCAGNDVYASELHKGYEEYFLACKNSSDNLYDIDLLCSGDGWLGGKGQEDCKNKLEQIFMNFILHK